LLFDLDPHTSYGIRSKAFFNPQTKAENFVLKTMPIYRPDKEVMRAEKELLADAIKKRMDREHSFSLRNSPTKEYNEILSEPPSKTALDHMPQDASSARHSIAATSVSSK
jgi:hypothetical protein